MAEVEKVAVTGEEIARFWPKVDRRGPDECWPWIAGKFSGGYGAFTAFGRKNVKAHRISFMIAKGTIPDGHVIDHICRNPSCVNPAHLRAVTARINSIENSVGPTAANAVKTHCKHGHALKGYNLIIRRGGSRRCRECMLQCCRRYHMRKAAAIQARIDQ